MTTFQSKTLTNGKVIPMVASKSDLTVTSRQPGGKYVQPVLFEDRSFLMGVAGYLDYFQWNKNSVGINYPGTLYMQGTFTNADLGGGRQVKGVVDINGVAQSLFLLGCNFVMSGSPSQDEFQSITLRGITYLSANATFRLIDGFGYWLWPQQAGWGAGGFMGSGLIKKLKVKH